MVWDDSSEEWRSVPGLPGRRLRTNGHNSGRQSRRRKPPTWLISNFVVLALVVGALIADKSFTHLIIPDDSGKLEQVRQSASLATGDVRRDLNGLEATVSALDDQVYKLANSGNGTKWTVVDNPEAAIFRLAQALAVVSLVSNKGSQQSAGSAQGRACIDYFLKGSGSFVECGFTRADGN